MLQAVEQGTTAVEAVAAIRAAVVVNMPKLTRIAEAAVAADRMSTER